MLDKQITNFYILKTNKRIILYIYFPKSVRIKDEYSYYFTTIKILELQSSNKDRRWFNSNASILLASNFFPKGCVRIRNYNYITKINLSLKDLDIRHKIVQLILFQKHHRTRNWLVCACIRNIYTAQRWIQVDVFLSLEVKK